MKKNSLLTLVAFLLLASCGQKQPGQGGAENGAHVPALPVIKINGVPLNVEIVQDPEARQKGLMNRDSLPEKQGMLFVFEAPQMLSFWMRNTFIPLDIAFIDENRRIVDIQHMEPLDETKQYISPRPALYALEVNAGWFAKHAIKPGDEVEF